MKGGEKMDSSESAKLSKEFVNQVSQFASLQKMPIEKRATIFCLFLTILAMVLDVTDEEWQPIFEKVKNMGIEIKIG